MDTMASRFKGFFGVFALENMIVSTVILRVFLDFPFSFFVFDSFKD